MDDTIRRIFAAIHSQTFDAMQADLARATSLPALLAVTQSALEHTEKTVDAVREQAAVETACAAGCSFCCWMRIDALAHEVLLIARYLRHHWTHQAIERLLVSARERRAAELPMDYTARQRSHRPCVLLQDGMCSIYPVRPMACRRYFSGSLNACHQLWQDADAEAGVEIPLLAGAGRAAGTAVRRAFALAGYDDYFYDLNAALVEALEDPACEERWFQKQPAFSIDARTLQPPAGPPAPED